MLKRYLFYFFSIAIFASFSNCAEDQKSLKDMKEYTGPLTDMKDVVNLLSDSALVKVRLSAPSQVELKNGTQEFPKGLKVEFFDKDGTVSSVLTSNSGVYNKTTNIFTATGDVVVKNIKTNEQLNTEILYWSRKEKRVYTDKFVTIRTEDELLKGEGLTAAQDFSTYRIEKPTGSFLLEDEAEEDSLAEDQ